MTRNTKTKDLVLMGLLTAIVIILNFTPLGYLPLNPVLSISFLMIPVGIAAYSMGIKGGTVIGAVFGITSFIQAFRGQSSMGAALFAINPALTAFQCIIPRILDGMLCGFIADILKKKSINSAVAGAITGFSAAFFNTLFFMSSLMLIFGKSEYVMKLRESKAPSANVLIFVIILIGFNALLELAASTIATSAVSAALSSAKLIDTAKKSEA